MGPPARPGRSIDFPADELRRLVRRHGRPAAGDVLLRRDLPVVRAPPSPRRPPAGPPVALEEVVPGREVRRPGGGVSFLVPTQVGGMEGVGDVEEAFRRRFDDAASPLVRRLARVCGGAAPTIGDLVFLDLETTGLNCCPLFLIGTMSWRDGGLLVRQHLARTYAEEEAAIGAFLDEVGPRPLLVTFNGKSFDVPFLRMRAGVLGLPCTLDAPHLDLLHEARRAWRGQVPDCRLQTLEAQLCGRARHDDLPGAEVPEAYHAFVRTGDAREVAGILRHNLMDLVTLADLLARLPVAG